MRRDSHFCFFPRKPQSQRCLLLVAAGRRGLHVRLQPSGYGRVRTGGLFAGSALQRTWPRSLLPPAVAVPLLSSGGFLAMLHLDHGRHSSFLGGQLLVMALGAISGKVDLNLSFGTSHFPGKSFHSLSSKCWHPPSGHGCSTIAPPGAL